MTKYTESTDPRGATQSWASRWEAMAWGAGWIPPATVPGSSHDAIQANTANGASIGDRLKSLVHAGNVRLVSVEHDGRTVAEFPLTAGVIGVVLAPALAAIGALVALLKDCTIHIERASTCEGQSKSSTNAPHEGVRVA